MNFNISGSSIFEASMTVNPVPMVTGIDWPVRAA
jgi:hypothetical protein